MNRPNHLGPLMVSFALIGLAAFAALPVALELCVECTFPVNESLGAGLIWIWGQVCYRPRRGRLWAAVNVTQLATTL